MIFDRPAEGAFMNHAYLLTGGNLGDRSYNLEEARFRIEQKCGEIRIISSIYETGAWGITEQPDFLNQAMLLVSGLSPIRLLDEILMIEISMGRYRTEKFGPRTIDIDILLFNDEIIDQPRLKIPHPELTNRRFALAPLAEIAPELVHPVHGVTISQLLDVCRDKTAVKKYMPDVEKKDRG